MMNAEQIVEDAVTPETVHPSHDVREEGLYISDPRCQKCRVSAVDGDKERLLTECQPDRPQRIRSISAAMISIVDERIRQIEVEGWTSEHDDKYERDELARAAACYAVGEMIPDASTGGTVWPWSEDGWKPTWPTDRRRELVKAGALIVAEIERLDRQSTHIIAQAQEPSNEC
jgi:hypothetical protein